MNKLPAPFDADQRAALQVAIDEIIPPDHDHQGGWRDGVESYLDTEWHGVLDWAHELVTSAVAALTDHPSLSALEQTQKDALIRIAHEGFYAAPHLKEPPGWRVVGFSPIPEGVQAIEPDPLPTITLFAADETYDTIVVGAGTGGGVVAAMLADAGERVLLIERSRQHASAELRNDHLRGKRAAIYTPTAGPSRHELRVQQDIDGGASTLEPHDIGWGLNAMTVGGGTRLWQAQAWRFLPEDFQMASVYGTPEGSSLIDWPITYDDMAPFYELAEHEIGVCGDAHFLRHYRPQAKDFPMPALPKDHRAEVMHTAADQLGWRSGPLSFAINSVERHGRAACVACQQCVGHSCPVDAKAGSHNTVLRRAGGPGSSLDIVAGSRVLRIETERATATGVTVSDTESERTIRAGRVVLSAGAAETPRLLLWSGLGNDQVGRHLQSHTYALAYAKHRDRFHAWTGPGHSWATLDFNHHNPGVIGGGVIHDGTQNLPVAAAGILAGFFGVPSYGPAHTEFMRDGIHQLLTTMACGQQIPSATARVTLDPAVKDSFGVPVVRFSGGSHPADEPMHKFLSARCVEWLEAMDCTDIVDIGGRVRWFYSRSTTAGEHGAGTCRMNDDPNLGATDRFGKVHQTSNVFVADASLHPANGGVNPGFTVLANAFRIAHQLNKG